MWVTKCVETIDAKMKALQEPIPNQEKCEEFAADAYKYCIELFGPPADPHRPYRLTNGTDEVSSCSYGLGLYTISLSPQCETLEEQCMVIAHEMCHRFIMHRKGMRQQVWVDELLAFLTSFWILRRQGLSEYAALLLENYINLPGKIDLRKLREFCSPPWYICLKNLGPIYPEHFYAEVARLAIALMRIASSNDLCRLAKVVSLEQWIDSLPEEKQYSVCRILEVSSEGRKLPASERDLCQTLSALKAKGGSEDTIAELKLLSELQPTNGAVFACLSIASVCAEKWDAALNAYLKAYALGSKASLLFSRTGSTYYLSKDPAPAVEWLEKAAVCKPDLPKILYRLGCSLNSLGYLRVAHEAWERILTLEDNKFKDLARKTIAENPLPNGLDEE